ncbi:MAG: hypothetical protein ACI9XO_000238 [Paraglaciecola sp.]|jgi:hypothetical protein
MNQLFYNIKQICIKVSDTRRAIGYLSSNHKKTSNALRNLRLIKVSDSANAYRIPGISILCIYFFSLASCANIVAPTGGAKDKTPPKLIESESTKNFQTNFTKRGFELTYDEWLRLKDQINQVIVSPPLQYRPDIELKKKTVLFEFDEREELREDATYVINFGESITDYTEGNDAEMIFVFSTGDYIDSLEVKGNIVDAFSKEPVKNVLIMLYDNLADSVIRTERPFYFGKTDEKGAFKIQNIKSDTFKVVALIDDNLNYLYDNETEKIGFLDTTIFLPDSLLTSIKMQLFQEPKKLFFRNDEQEEYGRIVMMFNQKPENPDIRSDDFGQFTFWETEKDSVYFWYDVAEEQDWNIYFHRDTLIDTIAVKKLDKTAWEKKAKLEFKSGKQTAFNPDKNLEITFNYPLQAIDTAGILVLSDTTGMLIIPDISIDSLNRHQLNFTHKWKEGLDYEMLFLPNSLIDAFGFKNPDTLRQSHKTALEKDFGNIVLKFENLSPDTAYVAKLMDSSKAIIEEFTMQDTTDFEIAFPKLLPGTYSIEFIEDVNKDGKWTTGNYDAKRQAERVFIQKLEELRAQWDVEATVSGKAF